jgi:hypothetical protein
LGGVQVLVERFAGLVADQGEASKGIDELRSRAHRDADGRSRKRVTPTDRLSEIATDLAAGCDPSNVSLGAGA